mmetsp:Transcript_4803/g.9163  ORF Transcript_4803/g.9163 Transcript_4803/m.9163 type:complete len:271 (-) Transcript_4803:2-814(-)
MRSILKSITFYLIFKSNTATAFTGHAIRSITASNEVKLSPSTSTIYKKERCHPSLGNTRLYSNIEEKTTPHETWNHEDVEWVLSPPPDTPMFEKIKLKAAANAIRTELLLKDDPIPPVLCPKGGKAELECFRNGKKIAKFGLTTSRGPSHPLIDETIQEFYGVSASLDGKGIGAIIYMFVEPEYRGKGIGTLALEAMAAIQSVQGSDFTVLVADDNGSGKLIKWYEDCGFQQAPKLQEIFGSPDAKFGITMIRPTSVRSDIFAKCKIKWW